MLFICFYLLIMAFCVGKVSLTHSHPMHPFFTPENRKPYDFLMFSEGREGALATDVLSKLLNWCFDLKSYKPWIICSLSLFLTCGNVNKRHLRVLLNRFELETNEITRISVSTFDYKNLAINYILYEFQCKSFEKDVHWV